MEIIKSKIAAKKLRLKLLFSNLSRCHEQIIRNCDRKFNFVAQILRKSVSTSLVDFNMNLGFSKSQKKVEESGKNIFSFI